MVWILKIVHIDHQMEAISKLATAPLQPYGCPAHPNLSANSKNKNYFLITVKPTVSGGFLF